ncbi:MAG: hypothetical protein KBD63_06030 [Bacteriovoracaceae bacterium]|nr:hypothetical protein [Bacteriovoracaceae bacterium]
MKKILVLILFMFSFFAQAEITIIGKPKELLSTKKFLGKEYYTGTPGDLNQEAAYDRSENFAIGIKTFKGWNKDFLAKFVRNYGTLVFTGKQKDLSVENMDFLFKNYSSTWIVLENKEDWSLKKLDEFIGTPAGDKGKILYKGAPSKDSGLSLWLYKNAPAVTIQINQKKWNHEGFLKKFVAEKKGHVYYTSVPEERHYKWLLENAKSIMISEDLIRSWKTPYRFIVNFTKEGGIIEGGKEVLENP